MLDNMNRPMSEQERIDLNSLDKLVGNGAKDIRVTTEDGHTVSIKSVGVPKAQSQRNQAGQMQTKGINDILGQNGTPLGEALSGLAQRLGLAGGPNTPQKGQGAGMLNELAGFIANNFGRGQMGMDHMGGGDMAPPLPDALQMANSMNGGAPTIPEQHGTPPIPPGAGMSGQAMGMLGPQGGGGAGGLAGLLGPIMSAAGQGAPAPSGPPPMGGDVPPPPHGMGPQGMPPELAALLNIPGRAGGGPVAPGEPYMVGEQGPELMVPDQAGTIVPNPASPAGGGHGLEAQVESLIDQVIQIVEERGIPLLGPDGNMSPEALSIFIEVLQSQAAAGGGHLDPMAEQMGGGPMPDPGSDPIMGSMMSGAGGSGGAPMVDDLGSPGAMAPDMTGATPSGPDDIQALLAALGG